MSPLHSAAAGGHPQCLKVNWRHNLRPRPLLSFLYKRTRSSLSQALLDAGYDPNYMLHPWVRRNYNDERKSALFFAVSNNDMASTALLLEGGAMTNQDPVKCLQVPGPDYAFYQQSEDILAGLEPCLLLKLWLIPPVCWKVALRLGNYELIELLLRFGANVNYYCKVNTTHFPSALQYALKDEVNRRHGRHGLMATRCRGLSGG